MNFLKVWFDMVGEAANTPSILMSPGDQFILWSPVLAVIAIVFVGVWAYDKVKNWRQS